MAQSRRLEVINRPRRRDNRTIAPDELAELIKLDDRRERVWAHNLRAVAQLADGRGVAFETLYRQLELQSRSAQISIGEQNLAATWTHLASFAPPPNEHAWLEK